MTLMTAVERLLATARAEIGYLEKASNAQLDSKTANAGRANYTRYARDLDALGVYNTRKNGYAWCDVFVDWCFVRSFGLETALQMTGQKKGGAGAGCTGSVGYYKAMGRFFKSAPQAGDQIFFVDSKGAFCHTGIVTAVKNGRVYTIEGNTSAAAGVVANGGCVAAKSYALTYNRIGGYGRPNYALAEEDNDMMTKEQFKQLWQEMRKDLQDNDAGAWSAEARRWAVDNGLVAGGSSAEFNAMWEDLLTREQMVVLLYRFFQLIMGQVQ